MESAVRWAVSARIGDGRVETSVEAPDIGAAAAAALEKIGRAYEGEVHRLEVLPEEVRQREVLDPPQLDLVSLTEAAKLVGVTKQALDARRQRGDFPRPVGTPSSGHVWLRQTVLAAAQAYEVHGRGPVLLRAFEEAKTLADWARDERCAVSENTLIKRLTTYGWDLERAITEPARELSEPGKSTKNLGPTLEKSQGS